MGSQDSSTENDPLARSLRTFSRRWTLEILDLLREQPHRFSELHRELPGLSDRVLWERLRDLIEAGLIERLVDPGPPISSTYSITRRGTQAHAKMQELRAALQV